MKLLNKLKSIIAQSKSTKAPRNKCYFCKKSASDLTTYKNDQMQKLKVCPLCIEYAERRAFRK